jgi:hypothetical protein
LNDQPVPLPESDYDLSDILADITDLDGAQEQMHQTLVRLEKGLRAVIDAPGSPFAAAALARAILDGEAV